MAAFSTRNLIVLAVASCIALVTFLLLEFNIIAAAAKIIASTAFVAIAIRVGGLQSAYGRIVLLGLVFSWIGDTFLIGRSQDAFLAGLGAFLIAHVAYIAAFVTIGVDRLWTGVAIIPITAITVVVSMWLAPHIPPELLIPVRVYTAVISLMVIAAFGTRGRDASALILAGALMFFLSDLSVAALRLVHVNFPTYIWGLPLYYGGQVCLALSASQSRFH